MPKETRSNKIEIEKRIRTVQEWIIGDQSYVDILKQAMQSWGITDRQAKNYIKVANDRFREANKIEIEDLKITAIERRKKLARSLKDEFKSTPKGIRALLAIEMDISKLQGLYTDKVEARFVDKNGNDISNSDLSKLTDDELRILVELQRKSRAVTS